MARACAAPPPPRPRALGGARAVARCSERLGFGEDPVCFSEPSEEVDLHSLSPQSRVCGVHFPCASGHLEAAPWGDRRPGLFSTWGNSPSLGFFCSVHSHSLWLRQVHLFGYLLP